MSNTINGFSGNGATSVETSRTSSAHDTVAAPSPVQPPAVGEVRITAIASRLASLGEKLRAQPAVDAARVERISQALATGTYSISADKIASGLLQSEQALAQLDR